MYIKQALWVQTLRTTNLVLWMLHIETLYGEIRPHTVEEENLPWLLIKTALWLRSTKVRGGTLYAIVWGNLKETSSKPSHGEKIQPTVEDAIHVCVAVNSRGHVLEVHTSINLRRLHRRLAVVNRRTQTLDWVRDGLQYDVGTYPSICLNDNADKNLVETHQTNVGEAIWCRTGTLRPAETDE